MSSAERTKAWRKANPEKAKENARRSAAIWRERYPERYKEHIRVRNAENQIKKLARQEAIAGRPKPLVCEVCSANDDRIVFDHCHTGGHFRGWICDCCNKVLGLIKDDPERLRKLATYLENDRG